MKRHFGLLLIFLLFIASPVYASTNTYDRKEENNYRVENWVKITDSNDYIILSTPSVDEKEKVYDFAELLTPYEEEQIYNKIQEFINNYNMDLVIVTIDDNPRNSAMKFADDFYDYNSFGKNNSRDGILFLIDIDTRNFYISTTGEAIRVYDDNRIENILDYVEPYIKSSNYYEATISFIEKSSSYASKGVPPSNKNSYIDENGDIKYVRKINYFIAVIISGVITFITIIILVNKNKMIKKSTNASIYVNKSNLNITKRSDQFLTTYTTSISLSTSGGSSGGSSTHHSSSGSSHGGGGRSF